ncbi:hypothetical protein QTP88_011533 [Uroleucon formosanum]
MANKKNVLKRKRSTKKMVTKTLALRQSKKPSGVVEDRDPEESSVQFRFNNVDQNSSKPSTSTGSINDVEIENINFAVPNLLSCILFLRLHLLRNNELIKNFRFTSTPVQIVPIVEYNQSFNLNDIESYTLPSIEGNSNTDSHGGGLDCSFFNMFFASEKIISSEPSDKSYLPINKAVTNGTVAIGIGQKQLAELSATMEIPCITSTAFFKEHENLSSTGEEERKLAIEADVGDDGIPFCTVVTDGQWSKRSYKSKYNALSGVATIIGYKTKKVLFVGIRNRFSATGIEADGIAEGFLKSVELHKLKFNKLIGDWDSSVTKILKEILPYGPDYIVQKIECRKHMLRNYIQKLTFIAKKTNYPINLRQFILKNILRFRTAIVTAIRHRKNENVPTAQKIKTDLFNSPYHIFGEHSKCDDYFCKKRLLGEENWVQRTEICGMMAEIKNIDNRLVINSESLILDVDNNICEHFNSIINKYIDENYGLADELVDDLTPAEFKIRKDNFLNELKTTNREKLENETKDQSKSQLWYSKRKKRITYISCKKIVYDLLYSCINIKIKAIEYGHVIEIEAKKKLESTYNLIIAPVGLCVDEKILYLAASPDGLIGEDSIIEIKCPFSARNFSDIFDAIDAGKVIHLDF